MREGRDAGIAWARRAAGRPIAGKGGLGAERIARGPTPTTRHAPPPGRDREQGDGEQEQNDGGDVSGWDTAHSRPVDVRRSGNAQPILI